MVRPYLRGRRGCWWLLLLLVIGLALFGTAVVVAPPTEMSAVAQCSHGVKRLWAGDAQAAWPLLEAGFAARARASFVQPDDLGVCALALGRLRRHMSDNTGALEAYEVALGVFRETSNKGFEGVVLHNLGAVYEAQGRYGEAETYYLQALTIAREIGPRFGEGMSLNNLGLVYRLQGRYGEALTHLEQALAIAREVGDREGEGTSLNNLGLIYQAQKNYVAAQPYFEAAALFDSLRQRAGSSLARSGFTGRFAHVYRFLVLNTIRLSLFEKAFSMSERGRSRTFLDEISSGAVTLSDTAAGRLLQQEQALFARRRATEDELARLQAQPSISKERLEDLEAQRVKIQQDYNTTLSRLRTVNEELAALASGEPLGPNEVQPLLPSHTTLLAYFVLDDVTIAAFLLTRTQFEVVELPVNSAALVDNILSFRLSFADRSTVDAAALIDLHTSLITPLLKHISTPHLILVPHAMLHYMPFTALTDGTMYLGDRFLLATLPSASTLPFVLQKRKAPGSLPPPLILGNPTTARPDLPSLQYAEDEARHIGQLYGVTPLTRERATEQTLIEQAGGAGIVHLAAHGEFNASEPLESFIALAPDRDNQQDGQLTVREVYNTLRLPHADLVVLSACETNVGEISDGDEVVGLTRAFIFAGTPSVIATLWNVKDRQTGLLMEHFYTLLRAGASKTAALQKAQQAVRKVYPHPYYWGAFVLTGHGGEVAAHPGSQELPHSAQP